MLEAVLAAPVIVKVLGSLGLILLMTRFCKHLIVALVVGTVVLAFWSGHSPQDAMATAWGRFWSADNFLLMAVVFSVIWLSSQMSETGVMGDLVEAVRARVSPRASMAILPALIGLLPMPGGALFSAPLVDSCDIHGAVKPGLKAQTNHLFRHIWEFWWPLYPGVLLAMDITKLQPWHFMLFGIPLSACTVLAGYVFLLRRIDLDRSDQEGRTSSAPAESPLSLVMPIIIVIACYGVVALSYGAARKAWPTLPPMNKYVPMLCGLAAAMAVLQARRPLGLSQWKGILTSPRTLGMVAIIATIRIYGAFVEAPLPDGVPLVAQMRAEMAHWGVPVLATMMVIPLISGLTMGVAMGFVGASFPIVINLLGPNPSFGALLSTVALAYGFGYIGMMLSPVHVCLVVTCEHFDTPLVGSIRALLKPSLVILAGTVLLHFAIAAVT
jgi:hypothetical protein